MRGLSLRSIVWVVAVGLVLIANLGVLVAKEIDFTGEFTGGVGRAPGPPPQVCAERVGSCGSDAAVIELCNAVAGQGTGLGVFDGDAFLCINTATGEFFNAYYLLRGSNGSTLFGPFGGQNVPLFPGGIPGPPSEFLGFGMWAVDGGTGVYEGASSGFNPARVLQSTTDGVSVVYLSGEIEVHEDDDSDDDSDDDQDDD